MPTASSESCVLRQDIDQVRLLTLNRPARRNAIDLELRVALAEALEAAMADDAIRAIVLTGAGDNFCSGGDISTMRRQSPDETRVRAQAVQRVVRALWNGEKLVVAAVAGYAVGAGMALALACDRVVAASNAVMSATFTRVGLAGDMGIFASLPARVGPARAKQMLMLPRQIPAPEALALGLIDALAEPDTVLDVALADARQLAAGPPLALSAIKALLRHWPRDPFVTLEAEVEAQARLFDTDDFAEGVAAFHERRAPTFRGR